MLSTNDKPVRLQPTMGINGEADHREPNFSRLVFVRIKHCKPPDADHCDGVATTKYPPYTLRNFKIIFDEFCTRVPDYCQCADDGDVDSEPHVSGKDRLVGECRFQNWSIRGLIL